MKELESFSALQLPDNCNATNLIKFIMAVHQMFRELIMADKDISAKSLGYHILYEFQKKVLGFLTSKKSKEDIERMPTEAKEILNEIIKNTEEFFVDFFSLPEEYRNSSYKQ